VQPGAAPSGAAALNESENVKKIPWPLCCTGFLTPQNTTPATATTNLRSIFEATISRAHAAGGPQRAADHSDTITTARAKPTSLTATSTGAIWPITTTTTATATTATTGAEARRVAG
jgi:hypothetical protein